MKKFKPLTKEQLNELPKELAQKIKNQLRAYSEVQLEYANGEYRIGACCISSYYPEDYKYIGNFYQDDIYTLEERIENYRNEFHCEPYSLIAQLKK